MRDDVVNNCGNSAKAAPRTITAERLSEQLIRAQAMSPQICTIHPVPVLRALAGFIPVAQMLMFGAVSVLRQIPAAGFSARSQRFICHNPSPKRKKARVTNSANCQLLWLWLSRHGHGLSIFTVEVCLHRGQNSGKFFKQVSGSIRCFVVCPQTGHIALPFFVSSILSFR